MTAASHQARTRRRQTNGLVNLRVDVPERRFAKPLIRAQQLTPEEALRRVGSLVAPSCSQIRPSKKRT